MNKFKIGDVITGITGIQKYNFTTNLATMKVLKCLGDGVVLVEIITHSKYPGEVGGQYTVDCKYFKLVTKGGAPMARRTFKLIKELPELTKGALVQEKCDDGDQDYTVLDQSFIKYEDEYGRKFIIYPRKAVEEEPAWFTEVFKVSPEYMTQDALDQFEAFKAAQTPKRGRKPNSTTAKATRTKKVTKAA